MKVYILESQGSGVTMHIIVKDFLKDIESLDSIGEYFADDFDDNLPPKEKEVDKDKKIEVDFGYKKITHTAEEWCLIYENNIPMELCRSEY